MTRTLLWLLGGAMLGGIIHIVVILTLPTLAEQTSWNRLAVYAEQNRMHVLPDITSGGDNPLQLDPQLVHGVCKVDITEAPAVVRGLLPDAFWSVAIYNSDGAVVYSTTNRDGIGQSVDLGLFNASQAVRLGQQQIAISDDLLVVEVETNQLAIVVRIAPQHDIMRPRFAAAIEALTCGPLPQ